MNDLPACLVQAEVGPYTYLKHRVKRHVWFSRDGQASCPACCCGSGAAPQAALWFLCEAAGCAPALPLLAQHPCPRTSIRCLTSSRLRKSRGKEAPSLCCPLLLAALCVLCQVQFKEYDYHLFQPHLSNASLDAPITTLNIPLVGEHSVQRLAQLHARQPCSGAAERQRC